MDTTITAELSNTRQDFLAALQLFPAADFNSIPFEGSWSAGQVAEHVFKSIQHTPQLLEGASLPTHRDPAQHVPQLRAMFLDFTTKMKSPGFILPSDAPKDYSSLTASIADSLAAVMDAAKKIDTSLTVANFEFPGSGPVTRLELLNFISVHTQRHAHQIRKIRRHFNQA